MKFFEVTDRGDHKKVLVAVDKIFTVSEEPNGLARILLQVDLDCEMVYEINCAETYVDIFNLFCDCELI